MRKDYYEIQPCKPLEKYIKCFWILEGTETLELFFPKVVMPYGCLELNFHFGTQIKHPIKNDSDIYYRSFVSGQSTKSQTLQGSKNIKVIGVRFKPFGAYHFFKTSINKLTDKNITADDIFGNKGKEIEEQILNSKTNQEKIDLIQNFLISLLNNKHFSILEEVATKGIEIINTVKGQISIDKLSEQLYISPRQAERAFQTIVGISPKFYSRITRLQNAIYLLSNRNGHSLTTIAYECGYYDQAHFINDFKQFAGTSPILYNSEQQVMPGYSFRKI